MNEFPESRDVIWDASVHTIVASIDHFRSVLNKDSGKEFCKEHPEILASVVQSTMLVYAASLIAAAIQDAGKKE